MSRYKKGVPSIESADSLYLSLLKKEQGKKAVAEVLRRRHSDPFKISTKDRAAIDRFYRERVRCQAEFN